MFRTEFQFNKSIFLSGMFPLSKLYNATSTKDHSSHFNNVYKPQNSNMAELASSSRGGITYDLDRYDNLITVLVVILI